MSTTDTSKDKVKSKAKDTARAVKDRAESAVDEAKSTAKSTVDEARDRAEGIGRDARNTVADSVDHTAENLSDAAGNMTEGSPQADATARVASAVSGTADHIRNTDLTSLRDDITQMARRHPVAFAGAAALLGFAAGRFLKASSASAQVPAHSGSDVMPHHLPTRPASDQGAA